MSWKVISTEIKNAIKTEKNDSCIWMFVIWLQLLSKTFFFFLTFSCINARQIITEQRSVKHITLHSLKLYGVLSAPHVCPLNFSNILH